MDKYDKVIKKIKKFNSFLDDVTVMSKYELDNIMELGLEKFEFDVTKFWDNNVMDIKIKYEDLEDSKYTKILNDMVKKIVVFIKGWIFKYPEKNFKITNVPPEIEKYLKGSFDDNIWSNLNNDGVGGIEEEEEDVEGDENSFDDEFGDDDNDFGGDFGGDDVGGETDDNDVQVDDF